MVPPRKANGRGGIVCVFCGPQPKASFERFNGGRVWDPACRNCRRLQAVHEQQRRGKAEIERREMQVRLERERQEQIRRARLAAEEAERRDAEVRRKHELEMRAAEAKRREKEESDRRAAEERRAKEEAERIRVVYDGIEVLARRAAYWPGATEDQIEYEAKKKMDEMAARCFDLEKDLMGAQKEKGFIDGGRSAAEVGGVLAAFAGALGQVHPLLGIAGAIVAVAAEPVADTVAKQRQDHYTKKWRAFFLGLREPELELFIAILSMKYSDARMTVGKLLVP